MSESIKELGQLVTATANRLRLVQTDLAEETPDVREQYLSDELERALGKVVPAQRAQFLQQLQELFPSWDARLDVAKQAEEAMTQSPTDERELKDAGFLVSRLTELAATMKPEERQKIAVRLREAGLSTEGRQVWPDQQAERLRAALKLPDNVEIDPQRALEMLQTLYEFASSLDQLVWGTWKAIAPRSDIRGANEMRQSVPNYLAGDETLPRADVLRHLERLRQLTASLVSAISQTGRQYAQNHYQRYAPPRIEDWAKQEKKTLESTPVACWRKYKELFGTSDQATIERDIMQMIADSAERLMKGLGR